MRVPAICNDCGAIFPSAFEVDATNVTFSGCLSGPCPNCGGNGHVPDGTFNFIGNTIELLSGPNRTISELKRLSFLLRQSRNAGDSFEQIGKKIQKDLPELSSIKDILPKTRNDLYTFIGLILAIIAILVQLKLNDTQKIEINQVINHIYQNYGIEKENGQENINSLDSKLLTYQMKQDRVGRNDPCPCGSGKKFKKCCINKQN